MKKILVVDNQMSTCELLQKFLSKNGYDVETVTQGKRALAMINKTNYDYIICEFGLPDYQGDEFFEKVLEIQPEISMIFVSRDVNLKNAVDLIKRGAYNFLAKPLNPEELLAALHGPINSIPQESKNDELSSVALESSAEEINFLIGKSEVARTMLNQIERVGGTNYTVIIEGETGTGKESVARLIHKVSRRRNKPFVAVDCGSLSKEIAGSELFGHEKGAFTGATINKTGLFELANGGTIFLDEIANLTLSTQMALLRALQEKVIRKIGGSEEIPIDVRIIVATNEDLLLKTENPHFREDLFFRLSEFVLKVPTLRERKSDLPLFIDYFLSQTSKELGLPKSQLSDQVLELFQSYPWPGNIRELKNVIRCACLFVEKDNVIYGRGLPSRLLDFNGMDIQEPIPHIPMGYPVENEINGFKTKPIQHDLKSTAQLAESKRIVEVLEKVHYNKTKAAEILNIHRKTLYAKLKLMNLAF